jgi:N-acetyl-gamma-glutamylphosphate reductase
MATTTTTVAVIGAGGPTGYEVLKALAKRDDIKVLAIVRK